MGDDKTVPVIVTMRIKYPKCGIDEDETSEVDMSRDTLEQVVTGECTDCGAPVRLHMKRWQLVQ